MSEDKKKDTETANNPHRLTSLLPSTGGGLILGGSAVSKPNDGKSLLGLDRLAALKRDENKQQRNYRRPMDETPSHPGGVNREVHDRVTKRHARRPLDTDSSRNLQPSDRSDLDCTSSNSRRRYQGGDYEQRGNRTYEGRGRYRDYDDRGRSTDHSGGNDRRNDAKYRERYRSDNRRSRSREYSNDDRGRNDKMPAPPNRPSAVTPSSSVNSRSISGRERNQRSDPKAERTYSSSSRSHYGSSLDAPTPVRIPSSFQKSSQKASSSWDIETPAPTQVNDDPDAALIPPDDEVFERQFYLQEDEGHYVQDADQEDMGRFLFNNPKIEAREKEMEIRRQQNTTLMRRNPRRSAMEDDQEAWENNRLLSAGAAVHGEVSLDVSTEQDTRVTLLVHQVKPPFLDGRVSFSTVREAVPTVKDASSDFARMAREGSETLRFLKANRDKNAMRQKFWELSGTRMGNVVGIKANQQSIEGQEEAEDNADGEIDYKKSSSFAEHMKKNKDGPVSDFAKHKSIREQREFLPVFTVREELLNVVRENNVVVIVGETGSGKTTQLTQYLMEEGYCELGLVGCTQPRRYVTFISFYFAIYTKMDY